MLKYLRIKKTFLSNQIVPLSFLAIISTLSDYTCSIITTMIVGGKFSQLGLVVVGISAPISSVTLFISDMLCGTAVFLRGVHNSGEDKERGERLLGCTLIMITVIGVAIGLGLFFFAEQYAAFFNLSAAAELEAVKFIRARCLLPILTIYAYYGYEFCFRFNEKTLSGINIFFCTFGIAALGILLIDKYGIAGMSVANSIAMLCCVIVGIICIIKNREDIKFRFAFRKDEMKELFEYGFAYSQDSCYYPIFSAGIYWFMGRFLNETCMAVFAILMCVRDICSIFSAISYAAQNQLCVYIGEKNSNGIKRILNICLKYQFVLAIGATLLVVVFANPISQYFGMEAAYQRETILAVRMFAAAFVFTALILFLVDFYTCCERFAACIFMLFSYYIICGLGISIILGLAIGNSGVYIGTALASPIAILFTYFFVRRWYGASSMFVVDGSDSTIANFEYSITEENVIKTRDEIGEELNRRGVDVNVAKEVMLVFEEITMLSKDLNKKSLLGECTLFFRDGIEMVIRDNGRIIDLSDVDREIVSFRSYVVANIVSHIPYIRHINASNTNRLTFRF